MKKPLDLKTPAERPCEFIGNNVFIGSNSNLIAPLRLGDGVYIAAGTTVTQNLETDDFCIGRCRETVKPQRAKKYLDKKK